MINCIEELHKLHKDHTSPGPWVACHKVSFYKRWYKWKGCCSLSCSNIILYMIFAGYGPSCYKLFKFLFWDDECNDRDIFHAWNWKDLIAALPYKSSFRCGVSGWTIWSMIVVLIEASLFNWQVLRKNSSVWFFLYSIIL